MILDDFVMLGKTVPEANGDGRQFVCTAGYSLELRQAIRIYPMARVHCPRRWSLARIPLERNPKDSRIESWKIRGDRAPDAHDQINNVICTIVPEISIPTKREIAQTLRVRSLKRANENCQSLCVLYPETVPQLSFDAGEEAEMAPTPDLFGNRPDLKVAQRFNWHPRLRFKDEDGDSHNLMLRDWGCYEFMRKGGNSKIPPLDLEQALNLSTAPPLFCGNLNRFRNSWLIISVFHGTVFARPEIMEHQLSLLDDGCETHP
jgi:hypothetical protein